MIRVLIADDHMLFRHALLQVLQRAPGAEDIEIVGEAGTGRETIARTLELHPHVVLLDINMPDSNGFEAAQAIRKECPDTQVLILSGYEDQELLRTAGAAGAVGYLMKDTDAENLIAAIHAAHQGKFTICSTVAMHLLRPTAGPGTTDTSVLSQRELEILGVLASGLGDKEIAAKMFLAESTVKTHLRAVYRKLGARNRAQAIGIAIAKGLMGHSPHSATN